MTVLLVITVISAAAVTFLVCFFIALCHESRRTGPSSASRALRSSGMVKAEFST